MKTWSSILSASASILLMDGAKASTMSSLFQISPIRRRKLQ
jgi:hypothetical protein